MALLKIKNAKKDSVSNQFMDIFEWAYKQSLNDLQRLEEFQMMYDNTVDESRWPTRSKIPIPLLFTQVEKALPSLLDYLFPPCKFLHLNPLEPIEDIGSIQRAEWMLQHLVVNRMKTAKNSFESLKDTLKMSVGFGIVEPTVVTPPSSFINRVYNGSRRVASARSMGVGNPRKSIRLRYLSPGQIIVTPDGSTFNGHNRATVSFFIDTYKEDDFKKMFSSLPHDGDNTDVSGNANKLIAEARSMGFDARVPIINIIAALGGTDIKLSEKENENIPVQVPVLKCYAGNRHVWIANGTTVIFDQADKYQNLRCPLIRWTAWPDSKRFYPMSGPEASQKMAWAENIWLNAIFDIFTHYAMPTLVYDKTKTGGKQPERGPNGSIGMTGSIREAADYLRGPDMPQGMFAVGDWLQKVYGSSIGQEAFMSNAQPGLLRGGGFAFESLLQQITSRERMLGAVMEMHGLEEVVEQAMIFMQLQAGPEGESFQLRQYDVETGKEYLEDMTVTEEDLVHAYEVELDLKAKHKNSLIDQQTRLAEFNAFKNDPYFNQYELRYDAIPDESRARRLLLPRETADRIQGEERTAVMAERAAAANSGETAIPPTMAEQALAGASRMAGA